MPLNESMEDFESEVSVIDVFDIAYDIGKEFEKIIDRFGSDAVTELMPKVITALEHLEVLASKNERETNKIQELQAKISKLENDKLEKAEDRLRYERDLEVIEDHWRKETQDLEAVVSSLQEENKKLKNALSAKQDVPAEQMTPEVDIAALQRLRGLVDQLRDKLRKAEHDIASKNQEIDELSNQVRMKDIASTELSRKKRLLSFQIRGLIDERTEIQGLLQERYNMIQSLRAQLGEAFQEKRNFSEAQVPKEEAVDPELPRYTTTELKDILTSRNNLKTRVCELEEELEKFRPKPEPESSTDDESTVQGPLPYEPDDAPWKRSDSGIRKFFRKLFSESNVTFLGSSPKRSLSTLSKMSLATGPSVEASV